MRENNVFHDFYKEGVIQVDEEGIFNGGTVYEHQYCIGEKGFKDVWSKWTTETVSSFCRRTKNSVYKTRKRLYKGDRDED